jgi:hypothetical protein
MDAKVTKKCPMCETALEWRSGEEVFAARLPHDDETCKKEMRTTILLLRQSLESATANDEPCRTCGTYPPGAARSEWRADERCRACGAKGTGQ